MRLSNSKANTWRRCPKKFFYKYELGLRPKAKALALERGSWLHTLLEVHYENDPRKVIEVGRRGRRSGKKIKVGDSWRKAHAVLTKQFLTLFEEEREELGDLPGECERIMKSYLRRWKKEDRRYTVIDAELDEILTLPNGLEFNFIIDLIVEDERGGLWLWDHKTVSKFMDSDFMLLDAQLARYFWAAEKMGYTPLKGVVFNEIRTKAPAIPEVLKSGGLSQRKNIDTDFYTYAREIQRLGLDPRPYINLLHQLKGNTNKFFRRTVMPKDRGLTKRTMLDLIQTAQEIEAAGKRDRFPRTVNKTCTWDCEFKDVCMTEYFGGDPTSLIKANFESRD
jgi:RecB family exonuclease